MQTGYFNPVKLVGLGSPREFESPPLRLFFKSIGNYQRISTKQYLNRGI
jgi:hypothetical protein